MGGVNSDQNYIDLRKEIHKILQIDVGYGDINQSSFYKDLLKNIKYHDVCFNFGSDNPQKTGECNFEVIVGRYIKEDNLTIYMVENVTKFGVFLLESDTDPMRSDCWNLRPGYIHNCLPLYLIVPISFSSTKYKKKCFIL